MVWRMQIADLSRFRPGKKVRPASVILWGTVVEPQEDLAPFHADLEIWHRGLEGLADRKGRHRVHPTRKN